jgi:hypothetical protein
MTGECGTAELSHAEEVDGDVEGRGCGLGYSFHCIALCQLGSIRVKSSRTYIFTLCIPS